MTRYFPICNAGISEEVYTGYAENRVCNTTGKTATLMQKVVQNTHSGFYWLTDTNLIFACKE
jgi:hypothetical protein